MAAKDIFLGAGNIYVAPLGTTRPDQNTPFGTAATGYTKLNELAESIKITYERTVTELTSENALGKKGQRVTQETLNIETALNEIHLEDLQRAWGGTYTDNVTYETLKGGGNICIPTVEWVFEFPYYADEDCGSPLPLRLAIIGEAEKGGGTLEFGKTVQSKIPLMISASHDTSKPAGEQLFEWLKVLA